MWYDLEPERSSASGVLVLATRLATQDGRTRRRSRNGTPTPFSLSIAFLRNYPLATTFNHFLALSLYLPVVLTSVWVTLKMWGVVCLSNPRKLFKSLPKMLQLQYVWGHQSSKQVGLVQCQQYAQDNRAWGSTPTKEKYIRALLKSREGAAAWVFKVLIVIANPTYKQNTAILSLCPSVHHRRLNLSR